MSKHRFSYTEKIALWRAYNRKCFYTEEPLEFKDIEIDHLIPESILDSPDEFEKIRNELGLDDSFEINSFFNWVPVKHNINNRKGDIKFSEQTLRYYLEMVRNKQVIINREFTLLKKQSENAGLLTKVAVRIENGYISKQEAIDFLQGIPSPKVKGTSEPIVCCFGLNIEELFEKNRIPENAPRDYIHLCDWFENKLLDSANNLTISIATEASAINGETLSIRIAFWHLNIDKLKEKEFFPWEILELSMFSEIYEEGWDELYLQALLNRFPSSPAIAYGYYLNSQIDGMV